jgi:hypothetical protein
LAKRRLFRAEVARLHELVANDAAVARMTTCIPEVTGQINGLSVETSTLTVGEKTLVTGAYLEPGKQVSTYCQQTLEPNTGTR